MPWAPPEGWWTMIRLLVSATRMPGSPAASRKLPIEAAWPMHTVLILGRIYCMVSWIARPAVTTPPGRIDVHEDVLLRVLGLEEQQLGGDERGHMVLDRAGDEDDPLAQQPRENVEAALAPVGLLDDDGDELRNDVLVIGHGKWVLCCCGRLHRAEAAQGSSGRRQSDAPGAARDR